MVRSDTDFLQRATGPEDLLVQTEFLCAWAERFARARGIPCEEHQSHVDMLRASFASIGLDAAKALEAALGSSIERMALPIRARDVLQTLAPMSLWNDNPSLEHAARWLVWLAGDERPSFWMPILTDIANEWSSQSPPEYAQPYAVLSRHEAKGMLARWIGALENWEGTVWGEFPFTVPVDVESEILSDWRNRIVQSEGVVFASILGSSAPVRLKRKAAQIAVEYYQANLARLTTERVKQLAPFLDLQAQAELQRLLPPSPPGPLDGMSYRHVLAWYSNSYLPYRVWQSRFGDEQAHAISLHSATEFARWYLEAYGRAIAGGEMWEALSFARSASMKESPSTCVSLLVVLDGLHVADAYTLRQHMDTTSTRLSLVADDLAFAPLPTVTAFCKPALLHGVPPYRAIGALTQSIQPLGLVLSDGADPAAALASAKPGDVIVWRLEQPDATYHWHNSSASLDVMVDQELSGVAKRVAKAINAAPPDLDVQVVFTSDHGRLLGRSYRNLEVPRDLQSHGRAAWGSFTKEFPESGFTIEQSCVYLSAERFGLPSNVVVALDESAFRMNDDKGGSELYAHGGLYPEEVIVPWLLYERDTEIPTPFVRLYGAGQSGREGTAKLEVRNPARFPITLESLEIVFSGGRSDRLAVSLTIGSLNTTRDSVGVSQWPTKGELPGCAATAHFRLASGRSFNCDVTVELAAQELYSRDDDILKDLGL